MDMQGSQQIIIYIEMKHSQDSTTIVMSIEGGRYSVQWAVHRTTNSCCCATPSPASNTPHNLTRSSYLIPVQYVMLIIHSRLGLPLVIFPSSGGSDSSMWMLLRLIMSPKYAIFLFFVEHWNYVNAFVCHFIHIFFRFLFFPGYSHHLPICPQFKCLQFCHISGGNCPVKNTSAPKLSSAQYA